MAPHVAIETSGGPGLNGPAGTARELVSLQCGSDLIIGIILILSSTNEVGADDSPYATQASRLGAFMVENNHVHDGPTKIQFPHSGEQNSGGTDVPCKAIECRAFTQTGNGERELELEPPCSSLFHHGISD